MQRDKQAELVQDITNLRDNPQSELRDLAPARPDVPPLFTNAWKIRPAAFCLSLALLLPFVAVYDRLRQRRPRRRRPARDEPQVKA